MIAFATDSERRAAANELVGRLLQQDLEACSTPEDFDDLLRSRCPRWPLLQHRDRCAMAVRELALMASDGFVHNLSRLHEFILYRSLCDWAEFAHDLADGPDDQKYHETLLAYRQELFEDADFLMVEHIATAALSEIGMNEELGIDVREFVPLMPADIAEAIEAKLAAHPQN